MASALQLPYIGTMPKQITEIRAPGADSLDRLVLDVSHMGICFFFFFFEKPLVNLILKRKQMENKHFVGSLNFKTHIRVCAMFKRLGRYVTGDGHGDNTFEGRLIPSMCLSCVVLESLQEQSTTTYKNKNLTCAHALFAVFRVWTIQEFRKP